MKGRTIILGAGFGGLTAATMLRQELPPEHEVLVIDRRDTYLMGLRKLWALAGVEKLAGGRRPLKRLEDRGIRFVQGQIQSIDPSLLRVETDAGTYQGDFLIVALGAAPRPAAVPGLVEHGANMYDPDKIEELHDRIRGMDAGRILVAVLGEPYKCPPAPLEAVMLLHHQLSRRGQDGVRLAYATCQPLLLPPAGPGGSDRLGAELTARSIPFRTGAAVSRVEAGRLVLEDGSISFDLLLGVPPHAPPDVVVESALAGASGWVAVDRFTLATEWDRVFAIGDVTQIPLPAGGAVAKAGIFAERQGERVAAAIIARVKGKDEPDPYAGTGACWLEMGGGEALYIEADFYAEPKPEVNMGAIAPEHAQAKRAFETERLERWFGRQEGSSRS